MAFAKGRISTEITYYNKVTSDVIMNVSIPVSTGFGSFYDNVGGITNQGVEFSLKTGQPTSAFLETSMKSQALVFTRRMQLVVERTIPA